MIAPIRWVGMLLLFVFTAILFADVKPGMLRAWVQGAEDSVKSERAKSTIDSPIVIEANWLQDWTEGTTHIGLFRGRCRIEQQGRIIESDQCVLWSTRSVDQGKTIDRITIYFEDRVHRPESDAISNLAMEQLETNAGLQIRVKQREANTPAPDDALFRRALKYREEKPNQGLQLTQLTVPSPPTPVVIPPIAPVDSLRRVRVFSRSSLPFNIKSEQVPGSVPPEIQTTITGGVNILIDGVITTGGGANFGLVDLSADNAVIWAEGNGDSGIAGETIQGRNSRWQAYLEGNIVIREGENIIRASRAFYDAREDRALVLEAELSSLIPDLGTNLRIRAQRLKQISKEQFTAQNAWVTTSQFGQPSYRFQASDILLEQRTYPVMDDNGRPIYNPATGRPLTEQRPWVTSQNNAFLLGEVPLLYAPYASAPAEDPNIPIDRLVFRQDNLFGTQVRTHLNLFSLLGLEKNPGDKFGLELDYLSKRGPLIGLDGQFSGIDPWNNSYRSQFLGSYIHDDGVDNLGFDRRRLIPENSNRGLVQWEHRHMLPYDLQLQAEVGYASDRNVREQFYEKSFDRDKDLETYLQLKQNVENWSWSILAQPQLNRFENQTEWLPRGDLYGLGEPLLGGWLLWSQHSSAAYAHLRPAEAPRDPTDLYAPIPYLVDAQGLVAMSRHELSAPFSLGPVQVVPYALGEAAAWSDSFTQNSISRLYGKAGLRGSLAMSQVFPDVQSELLNLSGVAHKMTFDFDYSYGAANRSLSQIPQWNEINDDAQERFQQRLLNNTFGGVLPNFLDPRSYALRAGAGGDVADPYHEIADDLHALRLGWRNRWQTKVGPPDRPRTRDWMLLDLGITIFPDAERDNFGETFGLFTSRYSWHFSDRTSLQASSLVDFFDNGPKMWNIGLLSQRSLRGSFYMGIRQIRGGSLDSDILTASYSYKMSPKWVGTLGTAYDIAEKRNRGQSLTITQVLPDFFLHFGLGFDASRNNASLGFSIEPRFGRNTVSSIDLGNILDAGY